jgi:mRNA interferase MazF
VTKSNSWSSERQDIIWIDCNPQSGQEMRDIQPFLVLSPGAFNVKKSLVIGLSTTMATHTADNPFAVDVGDVSKRKVNKRSYVLCHQL